MILILMLIAAASAEECLLACQRDYRPVCGSDGKTYSNQCQLTSFNCLMRTAVAVAYQGECVDLTETSCNVACQMIWQPVCGTNAVTYGNLCQLEADSCLRKTSIAVQHAGECVDAVSTGCNVACTMQWQPVCGTDAVTYGNVCALEAEACMKKTSVTVQHTGECAQAVTACNVACTMQNSPVCGTNGLTYGNLCQLESEACLKKTTIGVQYAGECVVEPVCNVACTMQNIPVCATNGLTYGNLCQLEADACLKKTSIGVQYSGECVAAPVCNVACTMQNIPVCGTNGLTYGNVCQLESDACLKRSGVSVARMGEC